MSTKNGLVLWCGGERFYFGGEAGLAAFQAAQLLKESGLRPGDLLPGAVEAAWDNHDEPPSEALGKVRNALARLWSGGVCG